MVEWLQDLVLTAAKIPISFVNSVDYFMSHKVYDQVFYCPYQEYEKDFGSFTQTKPKLS